MYALVDPDAIHDTVIRSNVTSWLMTYGALANKDNELIRNPDIKVNILQAEIAAVIAFCKVKKLPCRIVALKARQVGCSTISTAEMYHTARVVTTNCIILGHKYEGSTKNLEAMFWRFADNDLFDWRSGYKKSNQKEPQFDNGSRLNLATANDQSAGRSGTYQFGVFTEVAHWKETKQLSATKVLQGCLACFPKHAGVVIMESTANGEGNAYHVCYTGAITFKALQKGIALREAGAPAEEVERFIPPGWNGFVKVFMAWHEFPEYTLVLTETERARVMSTLSEAEVDLLRRFPKTIDAGRLAWRRKEIASMEFQGDEGRFDQEYPSDEESAFLATGSRVFNARQVKVMKARCVRGLGLVEYLSLDPNDSGNTGHHGTRLPIPRKVPEREAWLKVWERPREGMRYLISADTMTGETKGEDPDNHAILVWREGFRDMSGRWWARRLVARATDCGEELSIRQRTGRDVAACRWDNDILAERVKMLCDWYGRCFIAPEINMGQPLVISLRRDGYPVIRRKELNKATEQFEDYYGFQTTTANRELIISDLQRVFRNMDTDQDGLEILDPVVVQEFSVFARLKSGRTEAMTNWHDDQVMSCAIAEACKAFFTVYRTPTIVQENEIYRIRRQTMPTAAKGDSTCS